MMKLYMKWTTYWAVGMKSSKLWSSQLWTQFDSGIASSQVQTPLKSWNFQPSLRNCKNYVHNCEDHSLLEYCAPCRSSEHSCWVSNEHMVDLWNHDCVVKRVTLDQLSLPYGTPKLFEKNYITLKPLECFSIFEITTNKFHKYIFPLITQWNKRVSPSHLNRIEISFTPLVN